MSVSGYLEAFFALSFFGQQTEILHDLFDFRRIDRLRSIGIAAELEGLVDVFDVGESRHHDDFRMWQIVLLLHRADDFEDFEAVDARHHDVEAQEVVGRIRLDRIHVEIECLHAVHGKVARSIR